MGYNKQRQSRMVLNTVDFTEFLFNDPSIPFDISFDVVEEAFDEFSAVKFEMRRKTIKAHKIFLSAASPVFRGQFYGKMKSNRHIYEIRDTKIKAFEQFIHIIYGAEDLEMNSIEDMFDILDLADFYMIEPIRFKMCDAIKNVMTLENLKDIADAALTFVHHEEITKLMLKNCGKFLQSNSESSNQITEFLEKEQMEPKLIDQILEIKCCNCDYFECRDGLLATFPEQKPFRKGVKVKKWIRTGQNLEAFSCTVAEVILAPIPPNLHPKQKIEGAEMVLDVSDGTSKRLPLMKMTTNECDHWYNSKLKGANFLSPGGLIYNCKGV